MNSNGFRLYFIEEFRRNPQFNRNFNIYSTVDHYQTRWITVISCVFQLQIFLGAPRLPYHHMFVYIDFSVLLWKTSNIFVFSTEDYMGTYWMLWEWQYPQTLAMVSNKKRHVSRQNLTETHRRQQVTIVAYNGTLLNIIGSIVTNHRIRFHKIPQFSQTQLFYREFVGFFVGFRRFLS